MKKSIILIILFTILFCGCVKKTTSMESNLSEGVIEIYKNQATIINDNKKDIETTTESSEGDIHSEKIEIASNNELLIPFRLNSKIGFIDENFNCLLMPQYEGYIEDYSNKMVLINCNRYDALIGLNGQLLTKGVDSIFILGDDKYAVSQDGGYGFSRIFASDNTVIRIYDKIKILKAEKYSNVLIIEDFYKTTGARLNVLNEEGVALYKNNTFKRIFSFDFVSEIALIQDNDFNDCLVNTEGTIINKLVFQFGMRSLGDGLIFGKNRDTDETGYYNMDCDLVIKAEVKDGSSWDEWNVYPSISCGVVSLVDYEDKLILLSKEQTLHSDNWCVVDKSGEVLANGITADYIYPFSDDVAVVKLLSGDKWIYRLIDKNGTIITKTDYDDINSSINGYCMAIKDGIDYLICSKNGTVYNCSSFQK